MYITNVCINVFILKVILMFIEVCNFVPIYVLHVPNALGIPVHRLHFSGVPPCMFQNDTTAGQTFKTPLHPCKDVAGMTLGTPLFNSVPHIDSKRGRDGGIQTNIICLSI